MAEYIELSQATTLFDDVDARFDTVEGKIPSNASSGNKMVTASDIATKADLVDGKVPAAQLPSFVDDVLEYASTSQFPATGESGKIYVATDTNKTYRWGGSDYVEISESLALGETSSTAYAGDKGKANADAISGIQDLIPSGASTSNKLATASDIPTVPTALADLTDDSTHRVVTDTEKSTWNGKQDTLTFDNAPTANSDNPVKSGGVKTALDAKMSYADNAVLGAKNILENTASNKSNNNVSFVVNANKSVTVTTSGTVSAVTTLAIGEFKPLKETMVMNGVTGGSQSTYGFQLYDVTTSQWVTQYATDGDSEITLDISHTYRVVLFVRDRVASGLNTTVYPMISLSGGEYVPYAMTNRELTENKIATSVLKTVVAASSDFADFQTRIAAL